MAVTALGAFVRRDDGIPPLVRIDDLADEPVPHDVGRREIQEHHIVDIGEDVADHLQPGPLPARQVDLGHVAGDDDLRPESEPGQEHLHLLGRGVLRLVENDERVVQGSSPHVRQRGDLDGSGRHQPRDRLRVDHVVQRVVQRPQVRVDLVVERSRQEAQPLARLDGRPRENDPVDLLRLQRLHGLGHRQVRLAGAGRADTEDHGGLVDRVDIALLVHRFRPDRPPAPGDDVQPQHLGRRRHPTVRVHRRLLQNADRAPHGIGRDHRSGFLQRQQFSYRAFGERDVAGGPAQGDPVAAHVDVGRQRLFEGPQYHIPRAEKPRNRVVVGDDHRRFRVVVRVREVPTRLVDIGSLMTASV